nr:MAG TPA: portal protein [Caudoviricetes sp.]
MAATRTTASILEPTAEQAVTFAATRPPSKPGNRGGGMGFFERVLGLQAGVEKVGQQVQSRSQRATPTVQQISASAQTERRSDGSLKGITASANRITTTKIAARSQSQIGSTGETSEWQVEAWQMLDEVGEQRFLAHTLAGRMSQATLYVGKLSEEDGPDARPENVEDTQLQDLLQSIGDGIAGQRQIVNRAGVNLFVAGECFLVGIPPKLFPGTEEYEAVQQAKESGRALGLSMGDDGLDDGEALDISSLVWRLLSTQEVSITTGGDTVKLLLETGDTIEVAPDDLWLIRVWRSHPAIAWQADSPTRASLPVLRELVGLTQHISAQLDSRLAGAGLLFVNSAASAELKRQKGIAENSNEDPFLEALTEAMITPIGDRASASAVVPLVVTVEDPQTAANYMSFSSSLDKEAKFLRDETIRRLALGQDAPPELLLGTGGMNHWGAWLVREDVVTTHLEPPLGLLCDALTTQFLRPVMKALGYSDEQIVEHVVWYDVDALVARPNRAGDAKELYAQGVLSAKALREATGFEETDAPEMEQESTRERAVAMVLEMVARTPSIAVSPGISVLVQQIEEMLDGKIVEATPVRDGGEIAEVGGGDPAEVSLPDTQHDDMEPPEATEAG